MLSFFNASLEFLKWPLIIFFGIVGSWLFINVGWPLLFGAIAPKKYEELRIRAVLKDIRNYFGFLFDRGFEVAESHFYYQSFGDWNIKFESKECAIFIFTDRLYLMVSFAPSKWDSGKQIGLEPMIYYLSGGNKFIRFHEKLDEKQQYLRMANLLREYLDQIIPFFGDDFPKYEIDLVNSQQSYNRLTIERYSEYENEESKKYKAPNNGST